MTGVQTCALPICFPVTIGAVPRREANPRARAYCFTINGYTAEIFEALSRIPIDESTEYICYQKEVAPTTGQHHIQGYISFNNGRRFNAVRNLIPGHPHIEIAMGTAQRNREYCSKEGGSDFTERGTIKQQGERNDLNEVAKMCAQGASVRDICDNHPEVFIKYSTGVNIILENPKPRQQPSGWKYFISMPHHPFFCLAHSSLYWPFHGG